MKRIFILLFSVLFALAAYGQNDTNFANAKPTKESKKESRRILDSLSKATGSTSEAKKIDKKYKIKIDCTNDGDLEFDYHLGDASAKVVLYSSPEHVMGEFTATGTGYQVLVHHMATLYFYDLYINGEFIKTDKVKYFSTKKTHNQNSVQ